MDHGKGSSGGHILAVFSSLFIYFGLFIGSRPVNLSVVACYVCPKERQIWELGLKEAIFTSSSFSCCMLLLFCLVLRPPP